MEDSSQRAGRLLRVTGVLVSWHSSPVKTAEDLKNHELLVSATGASARQNWRLLNGLVGTRLKIISGYTGTNGSAIALERGEIEGMSFPWVVLNATRKAWRDERKVNLFPNQSDGGLRETLNRDAIVALLDRIGPAAPTWLAADARPRSERVIGLRSAAIRSCRRSG